MTATPDGKQALGVGPDNMPRVWNLETGDELQKIAAPPRIACAAYSPDGRAVALGADDGAVWLVPIEAEAESRRFEGHEDDVTCLTFEPLGGHLLSGGKDREVCVWEVATGEALPRTFRQASTVTCLYCTLDGQHLQTGSQDGEVAFWSMADGTIGHRLRGNTSPVVAVAATPDGREAFSLTADGEIRHWNLETGKQEGEARYPLSERDRVTCAAFSPGVTRLLVGTSQNELGLWNLSAGALEPPSEKLRGVPASAIFLPRMASDKASTSFARHCLSMIEVRNSASRVRCRWRFCDGSNTRSM